MHATFNYENICVQSIVTEIFKTWGAGPIDQSCLAAQTPPDFDGALPETQSLSTIAFGVADLWNNGGKRDDPTPAVVVPTCQSCPTCTSTKDDDNTEIAAFTTLALVIVILFAGVYLYFRSYLITSVPMASQEECRSNKRESELTRP